jgi:ABC-type lipoprotein export system ATPase subunit
MSEPFLSAVAVTKAYEMGARTLEVLRGVSLDVARGEFLALCGASGAGKSTLLHLFGGLDSPNSGKIIFDGRNIADLRDNELTLLRNRKVGFIFQAYHLLPELDALENVCMPARMARTPAAVAEKRGRELLTQVGLGARMDHKPYELSGGEQQRVAIARALINQPELILADEPTGNLDEATADEVMEQFLALVAETGAALLMVTHSPRLAARLGRRAHLSQGHLA